MVSWGLHREESEGVPRSKKHPQILTPHILWSFDSEIIHYNQQWEGIEEIWGMLKWGVYHFFFCTNSLSSMLNNNKFP